MIPRHSHALRDIAIKLAMSIAPETTTSYAAANAGMISMLLQCLAQDFDRAADTRMRDIGEMKTLFERALAARPDTALASRLRAYLPRQPKSFTLTDLDALHAEGQRMLIELHAWVESTANQDLDREIWAFLERFADRHAFQLGI
jgi:hypothetical protein